VSYLILLYFCDSGAFLIRQITVFSLSTCGDSENDDAITDAK